MAGQKKNNGADPRGMLDGIEDKGDNLDPDVSSAETAADVTAESASDTDLSEPDRADAEDESDTDSLEPDRADVEDESDTDSLEPDRADVEDESDTDSSESTEAEADPSPEKTGADEMVTVRFKNTYTGTLGVFHKKKEYTIPVGVAKKLEGDLDYVC